MATETRLRLAREARRCGSVLVFDETLIDFWTDGPPGDAATAVEGSEVIRLGSTGKSFWGGLRVGWIRAEPEIVMALANARASLDLGTPVLEQLAAAELLTDDDEALALRRAEVGRRRQRLLELLGCHLADWRVWGVAGGLSVWAELPGSFSTALAAASPRHGLRLAAGSRFGVGGAFERFVRLPFTLPPDRLDEAVRRLARAYADVGGDGGARGHRTGADLRTDIF